MNNCGMSHGGEHQQRLPPRALSHDEREIMKALLEPEFPGKHALRKQLDSAQVAAECACGCRSITFVVEGYNEPPTPTTLLVPVEAEAYDTDGVPVYVILHVWDGLLHELEILRADSQPLQHLPSAQSLDVSAN